MSLISLDSFLSKKTIGSEAVLITAGEYRDFDGTLIIMKVGKKLVQIKEKIREHGKKA